MIQSWISLSLSENVTSREMIWITISKVMATVQGITQQPLIPLLPDFYSLLKESQELGDHKSASLA